jgi:hypothetical protein
MKWFVITIWSLLLVFVILTRVENVNATFVCDTWLHANTKIQLLEHARIQLQEKYSELSKKVEDLEEQFRIQEIKKMEGDRDQKELLVKAKRQELRGTQGQAADLAPERLQANLDAAYQSLWKEQEKLANIKALEERLERDAEVSNLRRELQEKKEEFQRLFGNKSPEEVLQVLNTVPHGSHPIFANTLVKDMAIEGGRRGSFTDPHRDPDVAEMLGKLSNKELEEKDKEERKRLKDLAKDAGDLPAKLKNCEDKLLTESERLLRSQKSQIETDERLAKMAVAEENRKLQSGSVQAESLNRQIPILQQELDKLKKELAQMNQAIEQKKRSQSLLETARAELNHIRAERDQVEIDLHDQKKKETDLKEQLGAMRDRLSTLARLGRMSGSQAFQANRQGDTAACQESRNLAMDALSEASALAAQNRACLNETAIDQVNSLLQKADSLDCGNVIQQSNLKVVPSVAGFDKNRATSTLTAAGFTNIFFFEYLKPKRPEDVGKVINTTPPPGQMVSPDTMIRVSTFNNEWKDPEEADRELGGAMTDGGAWDREADQARVSATTHSRDASNFPIDTPVVPSGESQVERAKEVAQDATAKGPQAESFITHETLGGLIGVAAGIAGAVQGGGQAGTVGQAPPLTPIPPNVIPGIIPPVGGSGGGPAGAGTGSLPASDPRCIEYSQQMYRLSQESRRLYQQAIAGARQATSEQQRNMACQMMNNSRRFLDTFNAARNAGCDIRSNVSPEAISQQLKHWQELCSGSK